MQVATGGTVTFTAAVPGAASLTVTWIIREGSAGGSVSAGGLYTAPATPGQFHVTATSTAAPSVSGSATITVTAPVVAVTISPASPSVATGGTISFTATVTGTANPSVRWTVQEGSAGGAVSSTGVYTAPTTAGTYHVVATSQADPTKTATATVTVTGGGGGTTTDQLIALKAHGIYFGHQSVGANIMQGVDELLEAVPAADRLGRGSLGDARAGVWADDFVESNGDPIGKLADFRSQMGSLCGRVDIAFMKFCFADASYLYHEGPQSLFDAYRTTMSAIHTACPSARLVYFTMPLTNSENEYLEAYNDLVRAGYGSAVFDLANEESILPDGSRCVDGNGVRILCSAYHPADDGGHLNQVGRQHIAAKLIAFLANH